MDEKELIASLKNQDELAFRFLVEAYKNKVYNTILGIVQNLEDAEDLTQDVFIEIFKSIGGFRDEAKLSTWIYRIAVLKALDFTRKKKRIKRFAFFESIWGANQSSKKLLDIPDFRHPGLELENQEKAAALFSKINELPENQKIAFTLCKVDGLSYQEIAEIMGISVPSVESLLSRAKKLLQKKLEKYYRIQKD